MIENELREAAKRYYETFISADWEAWRKGIANTATFTGPLGDSVGVDERYRQTRISTSNPANLSYQIAQVVPIGNIGGVVRCSISFDYVDDTAMAMVRKYVGILVFDTVDGELKLIQHTTMESANSQADLQIATQFSRQYQFNKAVQSGNYKEKSELPSGYILIRGTVVDINERGNICNLYIDDGNTGHRYWCRGNKISCQIGDHVEIEGTYQTDGNGRKAPMYVQVNTLKPVE